MVDVRRVKLPGVGVLHTFITDDGGKCGVITHRSGHSDLITFADDEDGADVSKVSLRLSEDEAVVRGESANPAPADDFRVFPGDTLVVAGSPEKVAKAFNFYRTGELASASASPPTRT